MFVITSEQIYIQFLKKRNDFVKNERRENVEI